MTAFEIGVRPDDFWNMTPFEFKLCLHGYSKVIKHKSEMTRWEVWHGAWLQRCKDFPSWKKFGNIIPKNTVRGIDENAIKDGLKAYQAQKKRLEGKQK